MYNFKIFKRLGNCKAEKYIKIVSALRIICICFIAKTMNVFSLRHFCVHISPESKISLTQRLVFQQQICTEHLQHVNKCTLHIHWQLLQKWVKSSGWSLSLKTLTVSLSSGDIFSFLIHLLHCFLTSCAFQWCIKTGCWWSASQQDYVFTHLILQHTQFNLQQIHLTKFCNMTI